MVFCLQHQWFTANGRACMIRSLNYLGGAVQKFEYPIPNFGYQVLPIITTDLELRLPPERQAATQRTARTGCYEIDIPIICPGGAVEDVSQIDQGLPANTEPEAR
jgi:hypothetical protein